MRKTNMTGRSENNPLIVMRSPLGGMKRDYEINKNNETNEAHLYLFVCFVCFVIFVYFVISLHSITANFGACTQLMKSKIYEILVLDFNARQAPGKTTHFLANLSDAELMQ